MNNKAFIGVHGNGCLSGIEIYHSCLLKNTGNGIEQGTGFPDTPASLLITFLIVGLIGAVDSIGEGTALELPGS